MSDVTVIPAQPNWNVLWPYHNEKGNRIEGFTLDSVIAWIIPVSKDHRHEYSGYAIPVLTDTLPRHLAIRRPNGTICFPEDREFPPEQEVGEQTRKVIAYYNELYEYE